MDPRSRIGTRYAERYHLLALIGEGGMGAVFEARHTFTDRIMAVKIIHSSFAHSEVARQRVLREARAPTSIEHPSIVQILDAGQASDGSLYLAMERLWGRDLSAAIMDGSVDAAQLLGILAEVLDALSAAHGAGLVHRDIKPQNIFLSVKGDRAETKLLDFGITRDVGADSRLTATGTVMGTPHFMSPEQARGGDIDARSDLWAVGAVLYDALSGSPPFPGNNYSAVISQLVTSKPRPLSAVRPELPGELCLIIDRALDPDPQVRWQTAESFKHALEQSVDRVGDLRLPAASPTAPTALSHAPPPMSLKDRNDPTTPGQIHTFGAEVGMRTSPDGPGYVRRAQPTPPIGEIRAPAWSAGPAQDSPSPGAPAGSPASVPLSRSGHGLGSAPSVGAANQLGSAHLGSSPQLSSGKPVGSSPQPPSVQLSPTPARRKSRVLLWIGLILVPFGVVSLAVAAFFVWPQSSTDRPTASTEQPPLVQPTTEPSVLEPMQPIDPQTPPDPPPPETPTVDVEEEVQRIVDARLAEAEAERRRRAARAQAARTKQQAGERAVREVRCVGACNLALARCHVDPANVVECQREGMRCREACRNP